MPAFVLRIVSNENGLPQGCNFFFELFQIKHTLIFSISKKKHIVEGEWSFGGDARVFY